jgi:hypothetical protein
MEKIKYGHGTLEPPSPLQVNDLVFTFGLPNVNENGTHGVIMKILGDNRFLVFVTTKEGVKQVQMHSRNLLKTL